jgi:hypothetical protein
LLARVAAAQPAPGVVFNEAETPDIVACDGSGACFRYETGMALERFDALAGWLELLGESGERAVLKHGECWRLPDRSIAATYRLRPQLYDPVARGVDCSNPLPFWLPPACPSVVTNSPPAGSRVCSQTIRVVDPVVRSQCFADISVSNAALSQSWLDLADSQATLSMCQVQRVFQDADGDGEEDSSDRCPGTPPGAPVDSDGCSREQFCSGPAALCKRKDWLNDEPGVKKPGDCSLDKVTQICR